MIETALHPSPTLGTFLKEQVRVVGAAVRREASLLVVGIFLMNAVVLVAALRLGETLGFDAYNDIGALATLATFGALFAPLAVWKGEARFGTAPLWLLPVDHRTSALGKVAAGWVWTMAVVTTLLVLVFATSVASGGTFGSARTLYLSPSVDPADISPVRWTVQWWQLAAIFIGPTIAYLATSALLLATPHPGRWVVGVTLLLFAVVGGIDLSNDPRFVGAAERMTEAVLVSRLGIDAFMTGGTESFDAIVQLTPDRRLLVQTGLPTAQRWIAATLVWLGGMLVAVIAAASRHRGR